MSYEFVWKWVKGKIQKDTLKMDVSPLWLVLNMGVGTVLDFSTPRHTVYLYCSINSIYRSISNGKSTFGNNFFFVFLYFVSFTHGMATNVTASHIFHRLHACDSLSTTSSCWLVTVTAHPNLQDLCHPCQKQFLMPTGPMPMTSCSSITSLTTKWRQVMAWNVSHPSGQKSLRRC